MVYLDILAYAILAVTYSLMIVPLIGSIFVRNTADLTEKFIVGFFIHLVIIGVSVVFGAIFWSVTHLWGS